MGISIVIHQSGGRLASSRPLFRSLATAVLLAAFRSAPALEAQQRSPGVVTLVGVLDSVRARYPLIEASRARVRAARGMRASAGAFGNPMLAYQVENAPLPGREAPPMERESMAMLTVPLEPLYQRPSRLSRAGAGERVVEAEAAAERQRVMLDAARAYYRAALAQVAVEASRDVANWLDSVVAYNRARVREGAAAEVDLIRTEVERDRARTEETMQLVDRARARSVLAVFLGKPEAPSLRVAVAAPERPMIIPVLATTNVDGVPTSEVVRAELRAARERVRAARAGVSYERSLFIRTLDGTIGVKRTMGTSSLIAGFSLPFPLFDRNRGEVVRASAERDVAALELVAMERSTLADLIAAEEVALLLRERLDALAPAGGAAGYIARADEARRIALGAYREGAVPLIHVLDAARAWADARVLYHRTLYAQHESVLELLVARGIDLAAAVPALAAGRSGLDGDEDSTGSRP